MHFRPKVIKKIVNEHIEFADFTYVKFYSRSISDFMVVRPKKSFLYPDGGWKMN